MFVGIANSPRDYAWGSSGDLAALLGRAPSGGPEAEYWLGTHHGSPSRIVGAEDTLADRTALPFIMKVLAASSPVSLQAHPSPAQAAEGFARENAAGIPLDAPHRNYKDDRHKPELIYAISDDFEALCGFRPVAKTRRLLEPLAADALVADFVNRLDGDESLPGVVTWLLSGEGEVATLLRRVVQLAEGRREPEFRTVVDLDVIYPGDAGILVSLLLNRVTVHRGEVIYLPAGNIHSYLSGLGIEVLASSDNVLRGGFTPKHVDVAELGRVLDFRPLPVPFLEAIELSPGVRAFRPDVPDFELVVVTPDSPLETDAPAVYAPAADAIVLCVDGDIRIASASGSHELAVGDAAWVTLDEGPLSIAGTGTLFLAAAQGAVLV